MEKPNKPFKELPFLVPAFLAFLAGLVPALFNFYVDPYELFFERERSGRLAEIAEKAHYPLWKLARYERGKHDTIILGDSRARAMRDKYWHSLGLTKALNLGYGGGTIPEIHETFQVIKGDPAIKNLIVGIQLRSFDEDHKQGLNRVPEAVSLLQRPVDYVFNATIAKTSLKLFELESPGIAGIGKALAPGIRAARASEASTKAGSETALHTLYQVAVSDRELPRKFERQVTRNARSDWRGFTMSSRYWSYLVSIADWAKANGKNLIFVIPPTIIEMQETIAAYGLSDVSLGLRAALAELGTVVDLDFPSAVTRDLGNFTDAYHFNAQVSRQIVGEVAALIADDKRVLGRVEKRRKAIVCPDMNSAGSAIVFSRGVRLAKGENCRIWGRAQS